MPRLRMDLSTRQLGGLAANFRAKEQRVQTRVRATVERNMDELYDAVDEATPERTGRAKRLLKKRLSENGLLYEVGWYDADFKAEGETNYMLYYIFGTRFRAGTDFFFPLRDQQTRKFLSELRADLRGAR